MVAMVNVGGKLVPENQTFSYYTGYGSTGTITAAQAADTLRRSPAARKDSSGWSLDEGDQTGAFLEMNAPVEVPKPQPAPKAAPRPAAPKKSVLAPQAPPPAPLDQKVTQKERDEITKPAKGLESTIKTSPTLLREKRRKSYLTSGG